MKEPTFRAYGTQVIHESLHRMLSHADAVREGEDIEAVHDMRVASRRLRAALSVFGSAFPGRDFARFERDVKAVTDALGAARDLDVMIDTLQKMEGELPPVEQAGIESFVQEKRSQRERLQEEVHRALDRMDKRDLEGQFERIAACFEPEVEVDPGDPQSVHPPEPAAAGHDAAGGA